MGILYHILPYDWAAASFLRRTNSIRSVKASTRRFVTKKMLCETQFYVAEGSFDRLKKRIIALLAKHDGRMDRSQILRNMPIDAATLKRLLATLRACNLIEDEVIPSGKVVVLLKTTA